MNIQENIDRTNWTLWVNKNEVAKLGMKQGQNVRELGRISIRPEHNVWDSQIIKIFLRHLPKPYL